MKITPPFENARIEACFKRLKAEGKTGLVTFTMAYDPDRDTSLEIIDHLAHSGADIIELGMPFSDPMADGPAIAEAGLRALESGSTLVGILALAIAFRSAHPKIPLILMGYYNPIYHYGVEKFVRDAAIAGVDGLIIVDLPSEEDEDLYHFAAQQKLCLIKLVTPTTDSDRLKIILERATGFVYYVSVAGITGMKSATGHSIKEALSEFRKMTDLPIAVGFGIKTSEQIRELHGIADAVVVGSALVTAIKGHVGQEVKAVTKLVKRLIE